MNIKPKAIWLFVVYALHALSLHGITSEDLRRGRRGRRRQMPTSTRPASSVPTQPTVPSIPDPSIALPPGPQPQSGIDLSIRTLQGLTNFAEFGWSLAVARGRFNQAMVMIRDVRQREGDVPQIRPVIIRLHLVLVRRLNQLWTLDRPARDEVNFYYTSLETLLNLASDMHMVDLPEPDPRRDQEVFEKFKNLVNAYFDLRSFVEFTLDDMKLKLTVLDDRKTSIAVHGLLSIGIIPNVNTRLRNVRLRIRNVEGIYRAEEELSEGQESEVATKLLLITTATSMSQSDRTQYNEIFDSVYAENHLHVETAEWDDAVKNLKSLYMNGLKAYWQIQEGLGYVSEYLRSVRTFNVAARRAEPPISTHVYDLITAFYDVWPSFAKLIRERHPQVIFGHPFVQPLSVEDLHPRITNIFDAYDKKLTALEQKWAAVPQEIKTSWGEGKLIELRLVAISFSDMIEKRRRSILSDLREKVQVQDINLGMVEDVLKVLNVAESWGASERTGAVVEPRVRELSSFIRAQFKRYWWRKMPIHGIEFDFLQTILALATRIDQFAANETLSPVIILGRVFPLFLTAYARLSDEMSKAPQNRLRQKLFYTNVVTSRRELDKALKQIPASFANELGRPPVEKFYASTLQKAQQLFGSTPSPRPEASESTTQNCAICQEPLSSNASENFTLPCKHTFHAKHLFHSYITRAEAERRKCPIDRKLFPDDDVWKPLASELHISWNEVNELSLLVASVSYMRDTQIPNLEADLVRLRLGEPMYYQREEERPAIIARTEEKLTKTKESLKIVEEKLHNKLNSYGLSIE